MVYRSPSVAILAQDCLGRIACALGVQRKRGSHHVHADVTWCDQIQLGPGAAKKLLLRLGHTEIDI